MNRKNNHSSVKFSRLKQQIANNENLTKNDSLQPNSHKRNISNYFKTVDNNQVRDNASVPTNDLLENNQTICDVAGPSSSTAAFLNDSSDFETPKLKTGISSRINKINNEKQMKPKKKQVKKRTKTREKQANKQKLITQCWQSGNDCDVNPDHLQMAVALSLSLHEENNIDPNKAKIVTTLEQYCFKPLDNERVPVENKRTNYEFHKKRGTKFKKVPLTLQLRTEEERQELITKKIQEILGNQNDEEEIKNYVESSSWPSKSDAAKLSSNSLKSYQNEEAQVFKLNHQLTTSSFYVKQLNLTETPAKSGYLLKDWHRIPGREKTPTPTGEVENLEQPEINYRCVITPDLFESDNEEKPEIENDENPEIENDKKFEIENDECPEIEKDSSNKLFTPSSQKSSLESTITFQEDYFSQNRKICRKTVLSEMKNDQNSAISDIFEIENRQDNRNCSFKVTPKNLSRLFDTNENAKEKRKIENENQEKNSPQKGEVSATEDECSQTEEFFRKDESSIQVVIISSSSSENEDEEKTLPVVAEASSTRSGSFDNNDKALPILSETTSTTSRFFNDDEINVENNVDLFENRRIEEVFNLSISSNEEDGYNCSSFDGDKTQPVFTETQSSRSKSFDDDKMSPIIPKTQSTRSSRLFDDEINLDNNVDLCDNRMVEDVFDLTISSDEENEHDSYKKDSNQSLDDDELNYSCQYSNNLTPKAETIPTNNLQCETVNQLLDTPNSSAFKHFENDCVLENGNFEEDVLESPKGIVNKDDNVLIKFNNVTPKPDYESMDTPTVQKELNNYGVKPLKRRRGVQLLKHLYDLTHPFIGGDLSDEVEDSKIVKKQKPNEENAIPAENCNNLVVPSGDLLGISELNGDFIFEKKQPKKIHSCMVPLHIVWYNLLASNSQLKENVLLYEPLELTVLHSMLKEQGFNFHIQDLLTFLDKKCITVRYGQTKINSKSRQKKRR